MLSASDTSIYEQARYYVFPCFSFPVCKKQTCFSSTADGGGDQARRAVSTRGMWLAHPNPHRVPAAVPLAVVTVIGVSEGTRRQTHRASESQDRYGAPGVLHNP